MAAAFLTDDDVQQYHRDGYVFVKDLFSPAEVAAMIREVEGGDRVAGSTTDPSDATGKKSKLAIWFDLGDDIWAAASTCPRIVNAVRILLGEEAAFFHGKVMLKEAPQRRRGNGTRITATGTTRASSTRACSARLSHSTKPRCRMAACRSLRAATSSAG